MLVHFENNWVQKIPLTAKLDSACGLVQFCRSLEFFSSNYFQIGQHVVLLTPGQTIATCNIWQHCWVQHVACVWPPCCNKFDHFQMLHPTMLRYVAMACCDRLARALHTLIGVRSRGCPITGVQFELFVIGYL